MIDVDNLRKYVKFVRQEERACCRQKGHYRRGQNDSQIKHLVVGEYDEKVLFETLNEIVMLVINKYFSDRRGDDMLVSIGLEKCVQLLKSKHIQVGKGKSSNQRILNFLYRGTLNSITIYIKKTFKHEFVGNIDFSIMAGADKIAMLPDFPEELGQLISEYRKMGIDLTQEEERFLKNMDLKVCSEFINCIVKATIYRMLGSGGGYGAAG